MKALFIEPSRFIKQLVGSMLSGAGFEVAHVSSGNAALAADVKATSWDLICIPLVTGDLDGLSVCRQLRQQNHLKKTPIILLTGDEDPTLGQKALTAGFTEVFFKSELARMQQYVNSLSLDYCREGCSDSRILYLEDSQTTAQGVKATLGGNGYQIEHFDNGEAGMEAFRNGDYDLVITDFLLKGKLSGLGVVREIRAGAKNMVPILVVSAFEDQSRKIEILRSGANDFVPKPVMPEELLARVQTLVYQKHLVDELQAQKARLTAMALSDQLTTLYNRHCLMDLAPKMLAQAKRHGHALSVIIIDIDHFKSINDRYGHQAGDEALVQVSGILKDSCRADDLAARFGGEEFVLVLSHCDAQNASKRAESIRRTIETTPAGPVSLTASFGIAEFPPGSDLGFEAVLSRADKALYLAKGNGRNQVQILS